MPCALRRLFVGTLSVALALVGCTPTEIEISGKDPANPAAPVASLVPIGAALESGFDPQSAASTRKSPDPHAGHDMGHESPADASSPAHHGHGHQPADAGDQSPAAAAWTCPMHPEVRKSAQGNCPICGMKLQPVAPSKTDGGAP